MITSTGMGMIEGEYVFYRVQHRNFTVTRCNAIAMIVNGCALRGFLLTYFAVTCSSVLDTEKCHRNNSKSQEQNP
jgi:hypothetical protein